MPVIGTESVRCPVAVSVTHNDTGNEITRIALTLKAMGWSLSASGRDEIAGLREPPPGISVGRSGEPGPHATGQFVSAGRGYLRAMTKAHARADSFATALRSFEDTGDSSQLRELFAPNPELLRPQVATGNEGTSDVTRFWEEYRSQFSQLSTEFVRVMESGDLGVLEWVSRGTLTTGRPIEYSGTSLLNFDDEGRIRRFATYFDTAAFLRSQPSER